MKLRINTPSRLHFGIIDMRGELGRIHGSVGVSVKKPRLVLDIRQSSEMEIKGNRSKRAFEIFNILKNAYNIKSNVTINIYEDIPEHTGFGSGTQLALAIGTAINRIFELGLTTEDLARRLKRSRVSGIGTHGFLKGGFIIDGGHSINKRDQVPPLIFRQDFPEDWKLIICIPKLKKGFNGVKEQNAFIKLESPPAETVAAVSRIVLMQMIPAIIERDIKVFGDAMTRLDTMFGDYWEKIQGGTYSHPRIEECVNYMLEIGAWGAGQSSWGPALYGLADGEYHAKLLYNKMKKFLNEEDNKGSSFITSADNDGAIITEE